MHKLIAASSGGEGNPFQEVDKRALSPERESAQPDFYLGTKRFRARGMSCRQTKAGEGTRFRKLINARSPRKGRAQPGFYLGEKRFRARGMLCRQTRAGEGTRRFFVRVGERKKTDLTLSRKSFRNLLYRIVDFF